MDLKPLEKIFIKKAKQNPNELPRSNAYGALYLTTLENLSRDIYPMVDIGLTQGSKVMGIYTYHNREHFDEVVVRAGELIIGSSQKDNKARLSTYEIFVLLIAIRIHDAGNCFGREGHEKYCYDILKKIGGKNFPFGEDEIAVISNIAEAHGGTIDGKNKDVISVLPKEDIIGNQQVRSQRIAAIVRFSDEVAENRLRALGVVVKPKIPKANAIFHEYAKCITASMIESHESRIRVLLRYRIESSDIEKKFEKNDKEVYLIDEIRLRLIKMNQERIYCNRFVDVAEQVSSISALVRVAKGKEILWEHKYSIRDEGYPEFEGTPKDLEGLETKKIVAKIHLMGLKND